MVKSVYCVTENITCNCAAGTPELSCDPIKKNIADWGLEILVARFMDKDKQSFAQTSDARSAFAPHT